jgi:hypothetical protein
MDTNCINLKAREEAEVSLSSESDSDSYGFDCAKARDTTPPNAHIGTATKQIVHSIEACYIFHEENQVPKRTEIQHRRYSNPRRVGKKKPLDPRPRQTQTKAKRYTHSRPNSEHHTIHAEKERRVESKIHKPPHQRRKGRRPRHRRTYTGTDQKQVRKTQPKRPMTTGTITLAAPNISTNRLYTKHILNTSQIS